MINFDYTTKFTGTVHVRSTEPEKYENKYKRVVEEEEDERNVSTSLTMQ